MAFCQAACWESLISPRERTWRCTTLRPMRRLSTTDHERCSLPSFRRVPHLRNMPPVWRKSGGIKEGGSPLHALLKTVAAKSPANPHGRPRPTRRNLQTPFPVAEVGLKLGPDTSAEFSPAEFAAKKKTPRREKFLARMEALIPRAKLRAVLHQVQGEATRPGDAPDAQRPPMVFRDESTPRDGSGRQAGAHRGGHGGQRGGRDPDGGTLAR